MATSLQDGETLLQKAAGGSGHLDVARLVLDYGADMNAKNRVSERSGFCGPWGADATAADSWASKL